MGHKVNPRVFRATTTFQHPARWYASRQQFAKTLQSDIEIRRLIMKKFRDGGIGRVAFERGANELKILIHTAKPGMVIGRGGAFIEELKRRVKRQFFGSTKMNITVNIVEVEHPDSNAEIMAQNIRDQIEKRIPFRRAMKRAIEQIMRTSGVQGCKVQLAGRLNGVEIARTETLGEGRLPLQTLRADIDYSRTMAHTVYGAIGVKVWIYKGNVFTTQERHEHEEEEHAERPRRDSKRMPASASAHAGPTFILRKKADIQKEVVT